MAELREWLDLVGDFWPIALAILVYLRKHFILTRSEFDELVEDVNEMGGKITGITTIATGASSIADQALAKAEEIETRHNERWNQTVRTLEEVSGTMRTVSKEMADLQKGLADVVAEQRTLVRDVSRIFRKLDG